MVQLISHSTKTLKVRPNGRSADFITPNFIYGCAGGCRNSYCYVMRYNYESIFVNNNIDEILKVINNHINNLPTKAPNQTDEKYWTYDIGCSTDVSLHWKHTDWLKIFEFFKFHPRAKATFATKYVNIKMLDFNPEEKIRIRFSLMPQNISQILELKTSIISERIKAINLFIKAGYEVHLNFSPIVVYRNWLNDYALLFEELDSTIDNLYKPKIKAECIFLTHNATQHERNINNGNYDSEDLLWQQEVQEGKFSQYGGKAIRYKTYIKRDFIEKWTALHKKIIPWNNIRNFCNIGYNLLITKIY
jgi:spore photoproduct lyase